MVLISAISLAAMTCSHVVLFDTDITDNSLFHGQNRVKLSRTIAFDELALLPLGQGLVRLSGKASSSLMDGSKRVGIHQSEGYIDE